jgi:hypothetical protein
VVVGSRLSVKQSDEGGEMAAKRITGHANKVGTVGSGYDYANPTDPAALEDTGIYLKPLGNKGKGKKYGKVLSAAKGAGVAAIKGSKAGGIKLKGGGF